MMRLQKYLARSGVASRRNSEKLILEGRISVNREIVSELGTTVDEIKDCVEFDGKQIQPVDEKYALILNKPAGYVTSMHDEQGRDDISSLIDTSKYKGIFPVGRLDMDTRGLLILTNDGELGNLLMHPKKEIEKTYIARIKGNLSSSDIKKLSSGVDIGDYVTQPCKCRVLKFVDEKLDVDRQKFLKSKNIDGDKFSDVEITIHEGKNRQVRRMFKTIGKEVRDLVRVEYDCLDLEKIEPAHLREVNEKEMLTLRQHCNV